MPTSTGSASHLTAGADDRTRTGDLVLTKDALYLLSYIGPPSRSPTAHERYGGQAPFVTGRLRLTAQGRPVRRHSPPREGWSGRRGSNPRPTAWKAVTLPLSYSRLRASVCLRFGGQARDYRHRHADPIPRRDGQAQVSPAPRGWPASRSPPPRALLRGSGRRLVARGGFEPPKALGRQIYSLLRLTAPQPRRCQGRSISSPFGRCPILPDGVTRQSNTADERLPLGSVGRTRRFVLLHRTTRP